MDSFALDNIQGDILYRIPKKAEVFAFFRIDNTEIFRATIPELVPATASVVLEKRKKLANWDKSSGRMSLSLHNIGFSKDGLLKLNIKPELLRDDPFSAGQLEDAKALGDPMKERNGRDVPDWEDKFLDLEEGKEIHGIIVIAGNEDDIKKHKEEVQRELEQSGAATIVYCLEGQALPQKREHFGWFDGISQPYVTGFTQGKPLPGQNVVKPGVLFLGAEGDPRQNDRPAWAYGGTFMAFRKLQQFVPEFKYFLRKEAEKVVHPPDEEKIEQAKRLLCARLFGRWKSGAPLQLCPVEDDRVLAGDEQRNNDFRYTFGGDPICPYAAHIRKTNPRNNFDEDRTLRSSIVRAGIPYGEVFDKTKDIEEATTHKTLKDRGLAFVAYQSDLEEGFRRQQKDWSNNVNFPPYVGQQDPGFDGIIGQNAGKERQTVQNIIMAMDFVKPRAGGYFFVPSIETLGRISKGDILD